MSHIIKKCAAARGIFKACREKENLDNKGTIMHIHIFSLSLSYARTGELILTLTFAKEKVFERDSREDFRYMYIYINCEHRVSFSPDTRALVPELLAIN